MGTIAIFGATSTLAQALAERFVADNSSLILVGRSREKLSVIANHLASLNPNAAIETIPADFENLATLDELVVKVFERSVPPTMAIISHGALISNSECLS